MGSFFTKIAELFSGMEEARITMIGLDAAGKSTILYKLKLGEVVQTLPTIGFNVETVQYKDCEFTVWDVGGQEKIRPLWRHYYNNTNGIIFVVDSADTERIDDSELMAGNAKEELARCLQEDELRGVPVLVFANKQDLPGALKCNKIAEMLGLNQLRDRKWFIQACCAVSGDGLYEGLDWMSDTIKGR